MTRSSLAGQGKPLDLSWGFQRAILYRREYQTADEYARSVVFICSPANSAVSSQANCHPFCSSERGSNENANKIIRRYFHKGKSLYHVTQAQCDAVAERMNAMYRKILDYHTAQELFDAHINSLL